MLGHSIALLTLAAMFLFEARRSDPPWNYGFYVAGLLFALVAVALQPITRMVPVFGGLIAAIFGNPVSWFVLAVGLFIVFRPAWHKSKPVYDPSRSQELAEIQGRLAQLEATRDDIAPRPEITAGSHKGKPVAKLTEPERERISASLLSVEDYLTNEFDDFFRPYRDLMNWETIAHNEGGQALYRRVEEPRPTQREFIDRMAEDLKPYLDDLSIIEVNPMTIKTKALPLWDATWHLGSATQNLPEGAVNSAAFAMQGKEYSRVVGEILEEVERVRGDIKRWRMKIARGELG